MPSKPAVVPPLRRARNRQNALSFNYIRNGVEIREHRLLALRLVGVPPRLPREKDGQREDERREQLGGEVAPKWKRGEFDESVPAYRKTAVRVIPETAVRVPPNAPRKPKAVSGRQKSAIASVLMDASPWTSPR